MTDPSIINSAIRYIVYATTVPEVEEIMAFGLDRQQAETLIETCYRDEELVEVRDQGGVGCLKNQ